MQPRGQNRGCAAEQNQLETARALTVAVVTEIQLSLKFTLISQILTNFWKAEH